MSETDNGVRLEIQLMEGVIAPQLGDIVVTVTSSGQTATGERESTCSQQLPHPLTHNSILAYFSYIQELFYRKHFVVDFHILAVKGCPALLQACVSYILYTDPGCEKVFVCGVNACSHFRTNTITTK